MKATEFVKKFGIDLVKSDIAAWQSGFIKREDFLEHYGFDILDDLKKIVEAFELVESYGGVSGAKKYCNYLADANEYFSSHETNILFSKIKQAINLVEQCQNDR